MKYLIALFGFVALMGCSAMGQQDVTVEEFEKAMATGQVQVLDVRTPQEIKEGKIKGAAEADWRNENAFQQEILKLDRNKPVYIYCRSGGRSSSAAAWLSNEGFKEVFNVTGGLTEWKAKGKPVVTETE